MSIFRPKFSIRFILILSTVLVFFVAWQVARYRHYQRCEKAYQSLVECERGMKGMNFPSEQFADAANELRNLKHADAVTVVGRFEDRENLIAELVLKIVYPLAFEANADCPEERQRWFDIERSSYPGCIVLREGIPFDVGIGGSWMLDVKDRSKTLDRWGKVRSGSLPTKSAGWYEFQRKLLFLMRDWEVIQESDSDQRLKKFVDSMDRIGFDGTNDKKVAALRIYFDQEKLANGRIFRSHVLGFAKDLDIDLSGENLDEWGVKDLQ